ncbi:hypothetical protein [Candidatus Contubernalis alkaliaceticus]|uniref:hypothetical protein n=1 Tax=Candidatus Contubernalis alkaliaceticus TaxID=338645 RepID=UPI001F4C13A2|nr:hypothetical protein [Candidatus Contubernalis alkalaceticus]
MSDNDYNFLRPRLKWVLVVSLGTFILAVLIGIASEFLLENIQSLIISFIILLLVVIIGIIFDTIGIAATAADETPFHAKAAKKVSGAKRAIYLVRNADQVANFCNDVVGDISGIVSGVIGAALVVRFVSEQPGIDRALFSVVMTGFIASLTVGGKAVGKIIALERANSIIFMISLILTRLDQFIPGIIPWNNKSNKKRK